jgi:AbrB family looped-hinge helix DNA binding protein
MNTLETVKVSSRGQIVIPENVREDLGIDKGTKLILVEENGRITLQKEEEFLKKLKEQQERAGWMTITEKSLEKIWKNEKDDAVWGRY